MSDKPLENFIGDLAAGDLRGVLKDKVVQGYCLQALEEDFGCRRPYNYFVLFCISKALIGATNIIGKAATSRLIECINRVELIKAFLERIADLDRNDSDINALKNRIIDELKEYDTGEDGPTIDESLSLDVAQILYQGKKLDDVNEELQAAIEGLQSDFNSFYQNFYEPSLENKRARKPEGNSVLGADAIQYNSGVHKFVGRDNELNLLHEFLGDLSLIGVEHAFRWLLITGSGGEGKSRLALEFLKTVEEPWNKGFLELREMERFDVRKWRPRRPTLMIIDYPARAPRETFNLLDSLRQNAEADEFDDGFNFPVRVLLLEREGKGEWYHEMLPEMSSSRRVLRHCFRGYESGYPLQPISREAIGKMMRNRIEQEVESPHWSELVAAASQVDRRAEKIDGKICAVAPRPLFAVAVAEVLIPLLKKGAGSFDEISQGLSRDGVLSSILDRERDTRWRQASVNPRSLYRHENLLALATMCLGLSEETAITLSESEVGGLLPAIDEGTFPLDDSLMEAMGSPPEGYFNAIEPDILGEFYVLTRFEAIRKRRQDPQPLCDAAFTYGGKDTVAFVIRCATDFPVLTKSYNYFAPRMKCGEEAARNFALVCSQLAPRSAEPGRWHHVDEWFDRIQALRERFGRDEFIALANTRMSLECCRIAHEQGDWVRVRAFGKRIWDVHEIFPNSEEIAFTYATFLHATIYNVEDIWGRENIDSIVYQAKRLQRPFAKSLPIVYLVVAITYWAIVKASGERDWKRVDNILAIQDEVHKKLVLPDRKADEITEFDEFDDIDEFDVMDEKQVISAQISSDIDLLTHMTRVWIYKEQRGSGGEPEPITAGMSAQSILLTWRLYARNGMEEQFVADTPATEETKEICLRTIKDVFRRCPSSFLAKDMHNFASTNFEDYANAPTWNKPE